MIQIVRHVLLLVIAFLVKIHFIYKKINVFHHALKDIIYQEVIVSNAYLDAKFALILVNVKHAIMDILYRVIQLAYLIVPVNNIMIFNINYVNNVTHLAKNVLVVINIPVLHVL